MAVNLNLPKNPRFVLGIDAIYYESKFNIREAAACETFELKVLGHSLIFVPRSENGFNTWVVATNFQEIFLSEKYQSVCKVADKLFQLSKIICNAKSEQFKVISPKPYRQEIFLDFCTEQFNLLDSEANLRNLEKLLYEAVCEVFYPKLKAKVKNSNHTYYYLSKQINLLLRKDKKERFHGFTTTLNADKTPFFRIKVYNKTFEIAVNGNDHQRRALMNVTDQTVKVPVSEIITEPQQRIRIEFTFLPYFYKKFLFRETHHTEPQFAEQFLILCIMKLFSQKIKTSNLRNLKIVRTINNIFKSIVQEDLESYDFNLKKFIKYQLIYSLRAQLSQLDRDEKNDFFRQKKPINFPFRHLLYLFPFASALEQEVLKEFR